MGVILYILVCRWCLGHLCMCVSACVCVCGWVGGCVGGLCTCMHMVASVCMSVSK